MLMSSLERRHRLCRRSASPGPWHRSSHDAEHGTDPIGLCTGRAFYPATLVEDSVRLLGDSQTLLSSIFRHRA